MAYLSYKMLAEYVILEKMKDDFDIEPAKRRDVEIFIKRHYLQKFPTDIKRIYAVYQKHTEGRHMVGMIIYGSPFPTATKFLEPLVSTRDALELKRLYIDDIGIRNIESFVIGQSLKLLKLDEPSIKVVITFADQGQGHVGAIYQATNAIYTGMSDSGKHKYVYILASGKEGREIQDRLEAMKTAYPKKDIQSEKPMQENNVAYQAKMNLLKKIHAELEKTGKIKPPEDPETASDLANYDQHYYKMGTGKTPRVTSNEGPPEEDDQFELFVKRALGEY